MNNPALASLSARAGPSKRRNVLLNGNICEVVSVGYGPDLFTFLEDAEDTILCGVSLSSSSSARGPVLR